MRLVRDGDNDFTEITAARHINSAIKRLKNTPDHDKYTSY